MKINHQLVDSKVLADDAIVREYMEDIEAYISRGEHEFSLAAYDQKGNALRFEKVYIKPNGNVVYSQTADRWFVEHAKRALNHFANSP